MNFHECVRNIQRRHSELTSLGPALITQLGTVPDDYFKDVVELASGDTATCYEVETNFFKEDEIEKMVLKMYKSEYSKDKRIHECAVLLRLFDIGHPNILKPFVRNNTGFIVLANSEICGLVMESIQGQKFDDLKKEIRTTWAPCDKLWAFVQLVDAMNLLHSYGMNHYDLHTGNILFVDKTPVIIDVGCMANPTLPLFQRQDDGQSLWKIFDILFKNAEELPELPHLFPQEPDRNPRPTTIREIVNMFGDISMGQLTEVCVGNQVQHVATNVRNGIHVFALSDFGKQHESGLWFNEARKNRYENCRNLFTCKNIG